MNKLRKTLLILFATMTAVFAPSAMNAQETVTIDGLNYTLYENTNYAYVTGPRDYSDAELVIPATVTFNNETYKVTQIAENAFNQNKNITSVVIGDNMDYIDRGAFYYCENLASVTLGKKTRVIGHSAFRATKISSIVIPNSVTNILTWAFQFCRQLETITIGYGVTGIIYDAFEGCTAVENIYCYANPYNLNWPATDANASFKPDKGTSIHVVDANEWTTFSGLNLSFVGDLAFHSENNLVYYLNDDQTSVYVGRSNNATGDITIPDNITVNDVDYPVTAIGDEAFKNIYAITSVAFGSNVTTIGESAFYMCYKMTTLNIPDNVTTIKSNAFAYCHNNDDGIETIYFGMGLTHIEEDAFLGCSGVDDIYCYADPAALTWEDADTDDFKYNKYTYCHVLNVAEWSNFSHVNVTFRGDLPAYMDNGVNYFIDGSTAYVGESHNASGDIIILSQITLGGTNYSVTAIEEGAFEGAGLTSVSIPSSITTIPEAAFNYCSNLTSFTLPNTLTTIGEEAFASCGFTTLTIPDHITTIGRGAFSECYNLATVTIGTGVTSIGASTFMMCSNVNVVFCNANPANLTWSSPEIPSYIPEEYIEQYLAQYSDFKPNKATLCHVSNVADWSDFSHVNVTFYDDNFSVFTTEGNWNDATKWSAGVVPEAGSSVSIQANVTIPANYTANAGTIAQLGSTLTIKEGGQLICNNPVTATVEKGIGAWTTGNPVGGWNFIASPFTESLNPTNVSNMLAEGTTVPYSFDLYRLNGTTWENYHEHSEYNDNPYAIYYPDNMVFLLKNGVGYLYANESQVTLEFTGTTKPYNASSSIELTEGFNLVGNPYTFEAYINRPYYKMNAGGTAVELVTNNAAIAPCTGVVVEYKDGNQVVFTKTSQSSQANQGSLDIAVAQSNMRGTSATTTLDNAIITFNEGSELGKFYFGTQAANIYIPQGTEEYAIAYSNAQGEMPVNFKANQDGEYTLSINANDVEMSYLHLIDNMTGADIDLLQTPSYTFTATTSDYESRFRLMFASNVDTDGNSDNFAFFINGDLNIANEGSATLQVIDITGRILSSEAIDGSVRKTINATPGVYMIRLVNGENVKVQKVVVR